MIHRYIFRFMAIMGSVFLLQCQGKENDRSTRNDPWQEAEKIIKRITPPDIPYNLYSLHDLGGISDGVGDNKPVFDRLMALCRDAGGGKIIVPAGKYFIDGPIHLENRVEINLEKGAELIFGITPSKYLPVVLTRWEGTLVRSYSPLIYAFQKHDIAITGEGTINGNGATFFNGWQKEQREDQLKLRAMNNEGVPVEERIMGEGHKLRPPLIQFFECERIKIEGIRIVNSPFWCIQPVFSKEIEISGISFDAQNYNNDGIDPDSSEDIYIHDIEFDNRDDNIAIKSGRDREGRELDKPSRNIVIRRCRWKGHNAVCMGSEMSGNIYGVYIEDCSFNGRVRAGVYLKSNRDRGGAIHDIYVRNFTLDTCQIAIEMDTNYKNEGEGHLSSFYHIFIENLMATNATEQAIFIQGMNELPIHHVSIKNTTIKTAKEEILLKNTHTIEFLNTWVNNNPITP